MSRIEKNRLPPDLFSRNSTIAYLIQKLTSGVKSEDHSNVRVLDVGGYQGQLSAFLPEESHFTILDMLPPVEGIKEDYIQADARKIPFSDCSFDVVVASDMLEHVEKPFRAPVIRELLRVSKNHVIIGVPCKNDLVEKAEKQICDQFRRITGTEHPFLIEHRQFELPEEARIIEVLRKAGVNYAIIKEGNLMSWYIQQLYAVVQHGENMAEKKYEFYQFFNDHLEELGNLRAPTYRTIFVIAKDGPIMQEEIMLELQERNRWNPERFMEMLQRAFNDLRILIGERAQTGDHAAQLEGKVGELEEQLRQAFEQKAASSAAELQARELLSSSEQKIIEQEQRLTKAREALETYREAIQEVRIFLQEKERTISFLKNIVEEKDALIIDLEEEKQRAKKELEEQDKHMLQLEDDLGETRGRLEKNDEELVKGREALEAAKAHIQNLEADLGSHQRELRKVLNSRAWKVVMAYSAVKMALIVRPVTLVKRGWDILAHLGPRVFWRRLVRKIKKTPAPQTGAEAYHRYLEENGHTRKDRNRAEKEIQMFAYRPVISIVMPTYNVDEKWLRKAIESVSGQWYKRWELCMCDDASSDQRVKKILDEYAANDLRIKVKYRDKNGGIVKATNDALKLATGAYVAFLDNDDELTPDALFEVVKALQETKYDFLYSDEDKLDMEGNRCEPFFKPDWSPDLLLSHNYVCHFAVYRRKLVEDLGGLRAGFDGSQDYDLVLRVTEKTGDIQHIPKILYHWRKIPGSAAAEVDAKPYAFEAAKKALADAAKRRGLSAEVSDGQWTGSYRLRRNIEGKPLVSIIIPFKDKVEVLRPCVESILEKSTWKNFEILLVNNRSELTGTREYLHTLKGSEKISLLEYDKPFNFSAINNYAAKLAKGEYLLLLNNDTEVISPDWIESMLEHAQRPEVGAVGAKLLYPNRLVQHAGILVGIGGIANCSFMKSEAHDHGYFGQKHVIKNYSAVTGACLMVRKKLYEEMGGLDEKNLAVTFNDVDFCLRLREKGYLVVYTPYAELYHYESLTRGFEVAMREVQYMQRRHGSLIERGDPYYNCNLSRERFDFSLKVEDKLKD